MKKGYENVFWGPGGTFQNNHPEEVKAKEILMEKEMGAVPVQGQQIFTANRQMVNIYDTTQICIHFLGCVTNYLKHSDLALSSVGQKPDTARLDSLFRAHKPEIKVLVPTLLF